MEPLDSDLDYVVRARNPRARFSWLYIIPILGVLWLLFLLGAAIFQWSISDLVGPVMGFMLLFFFIVAGLLFWAFAPRENR